VRGVDLSQLYFDAVVGVAIGGEDVQAPAAGCCELLGDDPGDAADIGIVQL
jgi:hypothetical protein